MFARDLASCYGRCQRKGGVGVDLAAETQEDWWEVEALFDLCFAPGREALSSYRLRDGITAISELSLVARDQGVLAGAIRYWPIRVSDHPALLLGPIAVHPTRQGEGVGRYLIEGSLALATDWERVLLVGDEPYYGKFGFERLQDVTMPRPTNPERVLGRNLSPNAWRNISGPVEKWPADHLP